MGLDTTHGAWHGAYSAFMAWRKKIAEVAGLPPLELMEGFYSSGDDLLSNPFIYATSESVIGGRMIKDICQRLPIKWDSLKPSPLHQLLYHSDCDGYLNWSSCRKIADELERLLPLLPEESAIGHIGNWKDKTQTFIDGLRLAYSKKQRLRFR